MQYFWLIVLLVASFLLVPTTAHASGVLVSGQGFRTANTIVGNCSLAAPTVGGEFLTAGHCGSVGDVVYTLDNRRFGVIARSVTGVGEFAVIRVDSGWHIRPSGLKVSAPKPWSWVCKRGTVWGSPVVSEACGFVTRVHSLEACSTVGAFLGDSGGLVFAGRGAVGIVSRPFGDCGTQVFTRLDKLGYTIL